MIIVPVLLIRSERENRWIILFLAFAIAGVLGALIYFIFPVVGPRYAFHLAFLPEGTLSPLPDLSQFGLDATEISSLAPRNGMPSLHMAWVLLAFINTRGLCRRVRAGVGGFAVLTAIATLGRGEHYLVDLIVAFPFAIAVQASAEALVTQRRPTPPFWIGAFLVLAWLYALLYQSAALAGAPRLTQWAYGITPLAACFPHLYFRSHGKKTEAMPPLRSRAPHSAP